MNIFELLEIDATIIFQNNERVDQVHKAIEEMAELIAELSRNEISSEKIIEETADCLIMLMQLRFMCGIVEVDQAIRQKLARTFNRMNLQNKVKDRVFSETNHGNAELCWIDRNCEDENNEKYTIRNINGTNWVNYDYFNLTNAKCIAQNQLLLDQELAKVQLRIAIHALKELSTEHEAAKEALFNIWKLNPT